MEDIKVIKIDEDKVKVVKIDEDNIKSVALNDATFIGKYDAYVEYGELNGNTRYLNLSTYGDIPSSAWYGYTKITSLELHNCKKVEDNAFQNCSNIKSISNDTVLEQVGEYAFNGLKIAEGKLTLSDEIIGIPKNAFNTCSLLTLNIPQKLEKIEQNGFYNCTNLKGTLPKTLKTIESYGLYKCTSLIIDDLSNVESIASNGLAYCNLTTDKLKDNVTLGTYAFQYCTGFSKMYLNTKTITNYCFQYCTELEEIEFGNLVSSIANYSFRNCTNLTKITCHATTPPTLASNAFTNAGSLTIYVPSSSLETYKTATNWSKYADKMVGIEEE